MMGSESLMMLRIGDDLGRPTPAAGERGIMLLNLSDLILNKGNADTEIGGQLPPNCQGPEAQGFLHLVPEAGIDGTPHNGSLQGLHTYTL
jgi:hypothetical protein